MIAVAFTVCDIYPSGKLIQSSKTRSLFIKVFAYKNSDIKMLDQFGRDNLGLVFLRILKARLILGLWAEKSAPNTGTLVREKRA